jgi:hypothetical protein
LFSIKKVQVSPSILNVFLSLFLIIIYNSFSGVTTLTIFVFELSINSGDHFNKAALISFFDGIPNLR